MKNKPKVWTPQGSSEDERAVADMISEGSPCETVNPVEPEDQDLPKQREDANREQRTDRDEARGDDFDKSMARPSRSSFLRRNRRVPAGASVQSCQ